MTERIQSIIGVGTALVDLKVVNPSKGLPQTPEEVPAYLSDHHQLEKSAGGSMANAMSTLARLLPSGNINFLQRVGLDHNGVFYKERTPKKLINGLQVGIVSPTGTCIFAVTAAGQIMNQWPEVTFYGASDELEIPKDTGSNGSIFITNLNAYRRFVQRGQIVDTLREVAIKGNIFVFRLSGIQHGTDEKLDRKELNSLLISLPKSSDILFANAVELTHISETEDLHQATKQTFPKTRLMIITNGANGSLVRFEDDVFEIPAEPVLPSDVIDTTGAGDSYMGSMLAALFTRPYNQWEPEFIISCAQIGTYAASLVIQSLKSRLSEEELIKIGNKIRLMQEQHFSELAQVRNAIDMYQVA